MSPLKNNHNITAYASEDMLAQGCTSSAARLFEHMV